MKDLVKNKIKKYELQKKKIIIAVSGGLDSVVLLDLLAGSFSKKLIIVAHFNHGTRKGSDKDEQFVKSLAEEYGVTFFSKKIKPLKKDESYLRKERYLWLNELVKSQSAEFILTAHHLNDQTETVLLNLVRGSGPLELWGMDEQDKNILRPLIDVPKKELLAYAKKRNLKYREDPTNRSVLYKRNRIRHKVVPELEKINPSFQKTLQNNIRLGIELKDYIEKEVKKLERLARIDNKLKLVMLKKSNPLLVKELIKKMLFELTQKRTDIYSQNILKVFDLIGRPGTKKTELKGFSIIKDYDWLIFGEKKKEKKVSLKLIVGKKVSFYNRKITTRVGVAEPDVNNILLPLKFSDNLEVRVWQNGDKIKTAAGTKKLQDVFVDAKISKSRRSTWPVVVFGNEILWVPGLSACSYAKKDSINLIIEVK